MGKKWKKGKSPAKPKAAATVPQMEVSSTPTPQSESERGREPTEAEVMAIMHDDDLLEYSSSHPSERRKSMFEHYKRQLQAIRAAEERSKKVEAGRNALNPTPERKSRGRFSQRLRRFRDASKRGGVYLSDWAVLAVIVSAVIAVGLWAVTDGLYFFANFLFVVGVGLFVVKAIYDHRNHELKVELVVLFALGGLLVLAVLVGISEFDRRRQHRSQFDNSQTLTNANPRNEATFNETQQESDLRSQLRADGNRAIRLVTVRVALKRKYSIAEIGHFRVMYEVAAITNKIIPEFYLACEDYYDVNTFVDPKTKQFGYRWTVRYREPNGTYGPIESFSKGRGYGATTGLVSTTDELEFSADLYGQIPSDRILEDLFGKYLYIFVTESLVDKISEVSLQINNWELFSVKADRLISQDDKPIAPWFITLSKEEKAVPWRSVDVRFDEPLPAVVAGRFKGQTPGWTWSLDPSGLHPKKMPEPELKVDPFKRAN